MTEREKKDKRGRYKRDPVRTLYKHKNKGNIILTEPVYLKILTLVYQGVNQIRLFEAYGLKTFTLQTCLINYNNKKFQGVFNFLCGLDAENKRRKKKALDYKIDESVSILCEEKYISGGGMSYGVNQEILLNLISKMTSEELANFHTDLQTLKLSLTEQIKNLKAEADNVWVNIEKTQNELEEDIIEKIDKKYYENVKTLAKHLEHLENKIKKYEQHINQIDDNIKSLHREAENVSARSKEIAEYVARTRNVRDGLNPLHRLTHQEQLRKKYTRNKNKLEEQYRDIKTGAIFHRELSLQQDKEYRLERIQKNWELICKNIDEINEKNDINDLESKQAEDTDFKGLLHLEGMPNIENLFYNFITRVKVKNIEGLSIRDLFYNFYYAIGSEFEWMPSDKYDYPAELPKKDRKMWEDLNVSLELLCAESNLVALANNEKISFAPNKALQKLAIKLFDELIDEIDCPDIIRKDVSQKSNNF